MSRSERAPIFGGNVGGHLGFRGAHTRRPGIHPGAKGQKVLKTLETRRRHGGNVVPEFLGVAMNRRRRRHPTPWI